MALPPCNLLNRKLLGTSRFATKAADLTFSRTAAAIGPTSLLEWLTLWVAERTVAVFGHLNRRANTTASRPIVAAADHRTVSEVGA
jgi:hypothetical protein